MKNKFRIPNTKILENGLQKKVVSFKNMNSLAR